MDEDEKETCPNGHTEDEGCDCLDVWGRATGNEREPQQEPEPETVETDHRGTTE